VGDLDLELIEVTADAPDWLVFLAAWQRSPDHVRLSFTGPFPAGPHEMYLFPIIDPALRVGCARCKRVWRARDLGFMVARVLGPVDVAKAFCAEVAKLPCEASGE
jgi:hypothetical protein